MRHCHPILTLILPVGLAVAALQTGYLPFKLGVPLSCAVLLLASFRGGMFRRLDIWSVIGAFVFSAIGDYFLSNRRGHESYFIFGIGAFFVAHLGYLGFSLRNGRVHLATLCVLLAGYLPYFVLALRPAISDPILFAAVLLYLLISCVGLAAAAGLWLAPAGKSLYAFGILMVVVSDTLISFNEFLKYGALNDWILPTYYLAHLAVTASVMTTGGDRSSDVSDAESCGDRDTEIRNSGTDLDSRIKTSQTA